jgi:hypothetical protein
MSTEEVEFESQEPVENLLPHEEGYYDQEPIEEAPIEDTPPEEEARTIEIPDDPDEFDKFYEELSDEERESLDKHLQTLDEEEVETEPAQATDDNETDGAIEDPEGQPEIEHQISQQQYDSLPEEVKSYLDDTKSKLDEMNKSYGTEYQEGMKRFMDDPVVAERMKQLAGQEEDPNMTLTEKYLSDEGLANLKLDFDFDKAGSIDRIRALVLNATRDAEVRVHDQYKVRDMQSQYQDQVRGEFTKIQDLDESLKSELDYGDPSHPMNGFVKWLVENESNINLVNIGGVETYKLYLAKTGQEVPDAAVNARKEVVSNIARAKSQAARTIPKSIKSQGASDRKIVHGIDVERFKTDETYMDSIYDKHGDNPQMLKVLNSWSFGN